MKQRGWIFLQTLFNQFGGLPPTDGLQEIFLSDLPEEEAQSLLEIQVAASPEALLRFPETLLSALHYTWILPALKKLTPFMQVRLLGLLPKKPRERLAETTGLDPVIGTFIAPVKQMIIKAFFKELNAASILPKELLPATSLSPLLELSKDDIVTLIDLLGIHDLAEEMRGIVDQKKIQAIYRCLEPHQHRHLYLCLHQQEKVTSPPLDLGGWTGNCKTLQKKLHVRGIIRLAKALSGQHPDYIWHFTRILDTGRAEVLSRHLHEKAIPKVTPALQSQVIQTLNYVNSKRVS